MTFFSMTSQCHVICTRFILVVFRKFAQNKSSWQPMTSHVLVADEHSSFVHPDGMHIKQFTHGPLVDLNESAQYFALEDSIVNK